jgi:hypothetical protein
LDDQYPIIVLETFTVELYYRISSRLASREYHTYVVVQEGIAINIRSLSETEKLVLHLYRIGDSWLKRVMTYPVLVGSLNPFEEYMLQLWKTPTWFAPSDSASQWIG